MALTEKDTGTLAGSQLQERVISQLYGWDGTQWARISTPAGGGGITISPAPNSATFATGQKNVTAAGTGEQLGSQAIPNGFSVVIKAKTTNTGLIQVGNSKANAESASVSYRLSAGSFVTLFITNTNLVWIDATVSGEGVDWIVET